MYYFLNHNKLKIRCLILVKMAVPAKNILKVYSLNIKIIPSTIALLKNIYNHIISFTNRKIFSWVGGGHELSGPYII